MGKGTAHKSKYSRKSFINKGEVISKQFFTPSSGTIGYTPNMYFGNDLYHWHNSQRSPISVDISGKINQWNDLTGNGGNMVATGASRPTLLYNNINGKNTIKFDGTTQFFKSDLDKSSYTFLHNGTEFTTIFVYKTISHPFQYLLKTSSTYNNGVGYLLYSHNLSHRSVSFNNNVYGYVNSNQLNENLHDKWTMIADINQLNNPTISERSVLKNLKLGTSANINIMNRVASNSEPSNTLHIGKNFWGTLAETMIIKRVLTPTDEVYLKNWISNEWGIS